MAASPDTLPKIGAPATRALRDAGYTALRELAGVPRAELAALHGVGPKALDIIQRALAEHGWSLG
ncbi:helix-hairpin-helix domain-containing protein [Micromonospora auratinigra]|uniref:Helix-hairpin-helix domain-containing protein n=1 Tax=Micromonospora auratinigra TaxID=261654 RepID=A0A1A8ZSP1_9ACTN|nr:helix-hairpin-helix domain-containing protein [Micromonospora auratinigra]SBT46901.1 Helix-hairpin-helix domain-containing protein [Micromonospora auratinigra]